MLNVVLTEQGHVDDIYVAPMLFLGGPFREIAACNFRDMIKIKAAAEIKTDCDYHVPIVDFSVPEGDVNHRMREAVALAIYASTLGHVVGFGCMGGIGRTGLLMGCVLKTLYGQSDTYSAYSPTQWRDFVRKVYLGHALETKSQVQYLGQFVMSPGEVMHLGALVYGRIMDTREQPATPSAKPSWWRRLLRLA